MKSETVINRFKEWVVDGKKNRKEKNIDQEVKERRREKEVDLKERIL